VAVPLALEEGCRNHRQYLLAALDGRLHRRRPVLLGSAVCRERLETACHPLGDHLDRRDRSLLGDLAWGAQPQAVQPGHSHRAGGQPRRFRSLVVDAVAALRYVRQVTIVYRVSRHHRSTVANHHNHRVGVCGLPE